MNQPSRIPLALFLLRVTVFLVMLMWTLDKFVRPQHFTAIFQRFYSVNGVGPSIIYALAIAELLLLGAFVLGLARQITYGLVLFLHGLTTVVSYSQYLHPFEKGNILFFAAWPMLAACFALYYLRDFDTFCSIGANRQAVAVR